jgi:hypothetical protein
VHAIVLHAFGPAENLRYEELPTPVRRLRRAGDRRRRAAFPLRDAAAAHTALETRATAGKVVLAP